MDIGVTYDDDIASIGAALWAQRAPSWEDAERWLPPRGSLLWTAMDNSYRAQPFEDFFAQGGVCIAFAALWRECKDADQACREFLEAPLLQEDDVPVLSLTAVPSAMIAEEISANHFYELETVRQAPPVFPAGNTALWECCGTP
jgi:hypothetical protein